MRINCLNFYSPSLFAPLIYLHVPFSTQQASCHVPKVIADPRKRPRLLLPRATVVSHHGYLTQALISQAEASRRQLEASLDPPPTPPPASGPRATLVVCPVSVMSGWMQQLEEHTAGGMQARWAFRDLS